MVDQEPAPPIGSSARDRAGRLLVEHVKPRIGQQRWDRVIDTVDRDPARRARREKRRRLAAMSLDELAVHFRTDKWGRHHRYTQHYARHLDHLRHRPFTMLEIGIGGYARSGDGGASLRMWQAYFRQARIFGLDIQDKSFVKVPRVSIYQGSQVDPAVLRTIVDDAGGRIDVIIDDGSHRPEHIRETFGLLFPVLADDGIYAIEDTQTSYWTNWGGSASLTDPSTSISMVKDLLDGLNHEEFPVEDYRPTYTDEHVAGVHAYHNLVIIEKGANTEGSTGGARRTAAGKSDFSAAGHPSAQRAPFAAPVRPDLAR